MEEEEEEKGGGGEGARQAESFNSFRVDEHGDEERRKACVLQ